MLEGSEQQVVRGNSISLEHSLIKSNCQRVFIFNILVEEFCNQMNINYNLENG